MTARRIERKVWKMLVQKVQFDLLQSKLDDIRVVQGDSSRQIQFICIDVDGEPISTDDYTFSFNLIKPDHTFVIQSLTGDVLTITEQMEVFTGTSFYNLQVKDSNDDIIYSGQGAFIVDDRLISDNDIESVAEVNGLVFPDDFLTTEDLADYVKQEELEDYAKISDLPSYLSEYATIEYVDTAISQIQTLDVYSTNEKVVGTWIDGRPVYEKTFKEIPLGADGNYNLLPSGIDIAFLVSCYYVNSGTGVVTTPSYISRYGAGGNCTQFLELTNHSLTVSNNSTTSILWTGTIRYVKTV